MLLSGMTILLLCFSEVSIREYLTENTQEVKMPPIITHKSNTQQIPSTETWAITFLHSTLFVTLR
jgi:hypothetical protein